MTLRADSQGQGDAQDARWPAPTGNREIVPAEAEVIRRIFRDYAAGLSPKALAKRLNAAREERQWYG